MMPPTSLWLAATPPQAVRPVYDIPPVIVRRKRRLWLQKL